MKQYTCYQCGGVFDMPKDWTDKDAEKELAENFPEWNKEDCEVVCDDCYNKAREEFDEDGSRSIN